MREIELTRGYIAIVDDDDYDMLMKHKWHVDVVTNAGCKMDYPKAKTTVAWKPGRNRSVYMHRMIMGSPDGKFVDHEDGDTLNNQRKNLRVASRRQNRLNSSGDRSYLGGPTSSPFKGVSEKYPGKYQATITSRGKQHYLGLFESEVEAACRYDMAALYYHGEYARLNFDGAAYDKWYNDNHAGDKPSPLVAAF